MEIYGRDGTPVIFVHPSITGENPVKELAKAYVAHNKLHQNDGFSLFVFGTVVNSKLYVYPQSAANADMALIAAKALHATRGLRVDGPWKQL